MPEHCVASCVERNNAKWVKSEVLDQEPKTEAREACECGYAIE